MTIITMLPEQPDMVILVGLNMSMANWARETLIDEHQIVIPRWRVYTMGDLRRLEGSRFTKAYVYDPIRPGESSSVLLDRDQGRRLLMHSSRKGYKYFEGFCELMSNGKIHGPTQTL